MMSIKEQVARLQAMRGRLVEEIAAIQQVCPHEDLQGEYKSDTGNWCPDDDSYWIDTECLDCGKRWHIESTQPGYRQFNGRIIK